MDTDKITRAGLCDGLVAVVTGAGRGIGREHALLLAAEGADVVVNDLGGRPDGSGSAASPADEVAAEILALGGRAISNHDDVSDEIGAERIVRAAIDGFGKLDVLVNNAGVLRDRVLINLPAADWDLVAAVNLRGTYLVTRQAALHWRERSKGGERVSASVINTSSDSGLFANPGQANYGAAKSGVATLTQIAAKELKRYGVRVNAIGPRARTRLTEVIGGKPMVELQPKEGEFDAWHPGNVSPFVVYLASPGCELTGETFVVGGSQVQRVRPWTLDEEWILTGEGRWAVDALAKAVAELGPPERVFGPGQ